MQEETSWRVCTMCRPYPVFQIERRGRQETTDTTSCRPPSARPRWTGFRGYQTRVDSGMLPSTHHRRREYPTAYMRCDWSTRCREQQGIWLEYVDRFGFAFSGLQVGFCVASMWLSVIKQERPARHTPARKLSLSTWVQTYGYSTVDATCVFGPDWAGAATPVSPLACQ